MGCRTLDDNVTIGCYYGDYLVHVTAPFLRPFLFGTNLFPSQLGAHIDRAKGGYNKALSATLLDQSSLLYTMEVSCRKNVFMHYREISRKCSSSLIKVHSW